MDRNPGRFIPEQYRGKQSHGVKLDLNQPMEKILAELSKHPVSMLLLLSGTIVVGLGIAHAKFKEYWTAGKPLPDYLRKHPIYYAGPAKTPAGKALRLPRSHHRRWPHGQLRRPCRRPTAAPW